MREAQIKHTYHCKSTRQLGIDRVLFTEVYTPYTIFNPILNCKQCDEYKVKKNCG